MSEEAQNLRIENLFQRLCDQIALTIETEIKLALANRRIEQLEKEKADLENKLSDAVNK